MLSLPSSSCALCVIRFDESRPSEDRQPRPAAALAASRRAGAECPQHAALKP